MLDIDEPCALLPDEEPRPLPLELNDQHPSTPYVNPVFVFKPMYIHCPTRLLSRYIAEPIARLHGMPETVTE